MSHLLIAVYRGEDTAHHVLGALQAQDDVFTASLESLTVVSLRRDATFSVITEPLQSTASFWGVFWEALFGLIFRVPYRFPEAGSSLGVLFSAMEQAGLDERFRTRARRALRRDSSALGLFAGAEVTLPPISQPYLRPHAFVSARLAPDQDVELLKELGWSGPSAKAPLRGRES